MIKFLSCCLLFVGFSQGIVASEDEKQRNLRYRKKNCKRHSSSSPSIAAIASDSEDFSTLVSVLSKTGLDKALDCRWSRWCDDYTVFAPNNEAFAEVQEADADFFAALTGEDQYEGHLSALLKYHLVSGTVKSEDIQDGPVPSVQGEDLELSTQDGIKVNGVNVIEPFDVEAKNGIIHAVESVLLPSFITDDIPAVATKASSFTTLLKALQDTELDVVLGGAGPFTVFAPTDEAFADADLDGVDVAQVLKYHVVEGIALKKDVADGPLPTLAEEDIDVDVSRKWRSSNVVLNEDTNVVNADILAKNGVIHVIDKVLIPPSVVARAPAATSTILKIAADGEDFTTLAAAVSQFPELVDPLGSTNGDLFTVFAPTDKAFEDLGIDLSTLTGGELKTILEYHVIPGRVLSKDLPDSIFVDSLNGKGIAIDARDGVQLNGNTHVTSADIEASNGVIHVIDKVLIPPDNLVKTLEADGRFTTLLAVLKEAGLTPTLEGEGTVFTIFAPTDEAFSIVDPDFLAEILSDIPALTNLLLYHVADGFLPLPALVRQDSVPTKATGETISVRAYWWWSWARSWYLKVKLNGDQARVKEADILASNGVIHVIDGVLVP